MKRKTTLMSFVAMSPAVDSGTAESVEARTNVKQSAAHIQAKAYAFAEKMADDEDASIFISEYLEAKTTVAMGPQGFYKVLCATYTDEELAATPVPGTKIETKDEQGVVTRHNNPDEYDAPKADGSIGTVSRYWHWDVADALPAGKLILEDLRRAASLAATDEWGAKRISDNATKRQNNLRGLVARGIAVWHQINALEGYENVEFSWDRRQVPVYVMDDKTGETKLDKDGNAIQATVKSKKAGNEGKLVPQYEWVDVRTESPVILSNAEKDEEGKVPFKKKALSIVQFLSLDIPLAMEKGGSYDDLLATMRREQPEETEPDYPAIVKVGELGDALNRVFQYLDNDDNYGTLKRTLGKQSEGNDQLAETIQKTIDLLMGAVNSVPRLADAKRKVA